MIESGVDVFWEVVCFDYFVGLVELIEVVLVGVEYSYVVCFDGCLVFVVGFYLVVDGMVLYLFVE